MRARTILALLLALLAIACQGPSDGSIGESSGVVLPIGGTQAQLDLAGVVSEQFAPALDAIRIAIEAGDDVVARRALQYLFARQPQGQTLELALAFERILDGRLRCEWLDLELVATELPEVGPAQYRLDLLVTNTGPLPLALRAGGARLVVRQYAVDPNGSDQRGSRREAVPFPEQLEIGAGQSQRLEVARLALEPPPAVLAFTSSLRLTLLPGEFREPDGRYLPAQEVEEPTLEIVRLAGYLPSQAVEPQDLADYVAEGRMFLPALLERAVRVAPERRGEALDLLTPIVDRLDIVELELLVPALRWLAGTGTPGGSPETWRGWLRARSMMADKRPAPDWDRLLLPRR